MLRYASTNPAIRFVQWMICFLPRQRCFQTNADHLSTEHLETTPVNVDHNSRKNAYFLIVFVSYISHTLATSLGIRFRANDSYHATRTVRGTLGEFVGSVNACARVIFRTALSMNSALLFVYS